MLMVSASGGFVQKTIGPACLCSSVSGPLLGRHGWLGVTQKFGNGSNYWGLESSRSFHTHIFGTCAGMTEKLVSAQNVDWIIRKLLHRALASSLFGGSQSSSTEAWALQASVPVEQGGNCMVFYDQTLDIISITFYRLNLSETCPGLRRGATDPTFQ